MMLTMPPAVPLAARLACTHTRTLSALLSFPRNTGEQTQASPSITIKETWRRSFRENTVGSDLRKQAPRGFLLVFSLSLHCRSLCCPNRWRVPRLRGRTVSGLPNPPTSANPTNAESSRSRCCTTPEDSSSLGR